MGTYLTNNDRDSAVAVAVAKKIETLRVPYNDKNKQKGLEKKLLEENDSEIIRFILGRINPNFCLKTILYFVTNPNSSLITAGTAFNRISLTKSFERRFEAYKVVAERMPNHIIGRNAAKCCRQLANVMDFPTERARSRKIRRVPGSYVEIINFPKR